MMKKIKSSIILLFILLLSVMFSGCSIVSIGQHKVPDDQLQVHFISVGQGDSELIKLPTGENVLIDAGPPDCKENLINYLKNKGVKEINMAIATHPHTDHIGCMKDVFESFKVDNIMRPDCDYDSSVYTSFLYSIEENKINEIIAKPGYTFDEGKAHFEVLGPLKKYDDVNDMSVVVMMTYGNNKFLFTGDMQSDAEKDLINAGYNLNANVLKVGHHGSDTASSQEFLKAVSPSIAVIEVGAGNEYNLPKDQIITRIAQNGSTVYRTDKSGNIVVCSNGKKLSVTTDDSTEDLLNNVLGTDSSAVMSSENAASQDSNIKEDSQQTNKSEIADKSVSSQSSDIQGKKTEGAYIGNIKTKVYHTSECKSLPEEKNRVYFDTQEEAEKAGYTPHKSCVK